MKTLALYIIFAPLSFQAIEVASKLVNLVADSISEPEDIVDVMEITLSIFSDESTAISQTTDGVVRALFTVTDFSECGVDWCGFWNCLKLKLVFKYRKGIQI